MDEAQSKRAKIAADKDAFGEIELVTSKMVLLVKLAAKRSDSQRIVFLLEQLNARSKGRSYTYASIDADLLTKRKTPSLILSVSGGHAASASFNQSYECGFRVRHFREPIL